jgi:hypothetical protein
MENSETVIKKIAIGDSLKCLNIKPLDGNDVAPPLKQDGTYVADTIYKCRCGCEHIDVGLKSKYNYVRCHTCGEELPGGNITHWCHPSRFEIIQPTPTDEKSSAQSV